MVVNAGTLLLGRFRVVEERGRPGGARIYDALDEQSGEPARVVVLANAAAGEQPERVIERVSRYALGCVGIAHCLAAGIVGAAGSAASSRTREVAVAYATQRGRTLDDIIRSGPRLEPEEIARLLSSVASALSPLHDQGVAHAYLRPELITVTDNGVSLEGFGVAQLAQSLGGPTLARDALPVAYRAPELRGAMPARAETWADAFALGVLATELVAGQALPEHLDVPTPRALGLEVGDALESCIAEAVAASVGARPRDAELWALRLEAAVCEPGALVRSSSDDSTGEPPPAQQPEPEPDSVESASAAELAPAPQPPAEEPPQSLAEEPVAAPPAPTDDQPPEAELVPPVAPEATARKPPDAPSAPRFAPPPVSRRASSTWPIVLALAGGLLLMVAGVGAAFWFALSARASSGPVATASPPVVAPPIGPGPVSPAPALPGSPTPGGAVDGGVASGALPAPAPLPERSSVHLASNADADLPVNRSDPAWGDPDAAVTLLVFGNLDCPYTRRSLDVLQRLKTRFGHDLRLVWKNRPLPEHPHARAAAEVAVALEATRGDAAFWKFASLAAASSQTSTRARLTRWVSAAGGDGSRVSAWLSDAGYSGQVDRSLELAGRYNVRATPTFFVNGLRVEGYQPFSALARVVDRELKRARALVSGGVAPRDVYADRVRKNLVDLGPAAPVRTCPPLAHAPVRGGADALVTIVEYSDFQCPFCKRAQPTLDALREHYGRQLRVVWKNFPLRFHHRARPAANFAMEALSRGGTAAFWRVHDALFAVSSLDDASLERVARDAGLDPSALLDAARDATHKAAIDTDVREGQSFGVTGTPTFFVNGRELDGAQPLSKFEHLVDEELATAKHLVATGTPRAGVYAAVCGAH